jgi:hypothetical protein
MATTNTTRFGLTQWPSSDDDFTREQLNADHENISNDAAIFLSGIPATPPTIAINNTRAFYWDKTDGILYFRGDDFLGTPALWTQVHPVVPSAHIHADLQPLNSDLTAISGFTTSVGFPVRTASGTYAIRHIVVSGSGIAISNEYGTAGNPTISINSTSNDSPNTLVFRDSGGQFKIQAPTDAAHAATKQYVDTAVSGFTALTVNGFVSRTGSSTYEARTIAVSGSGISITNADGVSGNPTITVNSTSASTANTIVLRDSNSQFNVGSPSDPTHVATKSYVDTADALKANSADVYTKTNIHDAKLYQYANEAGGTGTALPSSGTRTTPRIYVQSTEPSSVGAITGDIWFQI